MSDRSIESKIEETGKGDAQALTELFDELRMPIYLLAHAMLRDHALAEDVVQETFLRVMTRASSYQRTGSGRAWILRIAKNITYDALRLQQRVGQLPDEIAEVDYPLQAVDSELDFLNATQGLSDLEKSIVIYKIFSQLTHAEIAAVVGMGEPAVRKRYRRILQQISVYYKRKDG